MLGVGAFVTRRLTYAAATAVAWRVLLPVSRFGGSCELGCRTIAVHVGTVAGAAAAHPIVLLRRRAMAQDAIAVADDAAAAAAGLRSPRRCAYQRPHASVAECAKQLWAEEGLAGFWAGSGWAAASAAVYSVTVSAALVGAGRLATDVVCEAIGDDTEAVAELADELAADEGAANADELFADA